MSDVETTAREPLMTCRKLSTDYNCALCPERGIPPNWLNVGTESAAFRGRDHFIGASLERGNLLQDAKGELQEGDPLKL